MLSKTEGKNYNFDEKKRLKERLFEVLLVIDENLPYQEIFADGGLDLLTVFFNTTFYEDECEYSVFNSKSDSLKIETHAEVKTAIVA